MRTNNSDSSDFNLHPFSVFYILTLKLGLSVSLGCELLVSGAQEGVSRTCNNFNF